MSSGGNALPNEIYGVFAGQIEPGALQRIFNAAAIATANGVKHIHLLFQSTGGVVGDGIALHNFFRSLPIDLTIYNVGQISSVAVIAYLGAKNRKCSTHANFMIHRTYASPQYATSDRLHATAHGLTLDDKRTEAILRAHLKMPDEKWDTHKYADTWLTSDEALKAELVTEIGDFAPPLGQHLFYVGVA